jgi:hypothetical protein
MSIATYSELKTAVDTWGKWGGSYVTQIPDWIALAEDWLARNLRVRAMESHRDIAVRQFVDSATVGGTADAITLTNTTTTTSYKSGEAYTFTPSSDNTAAVTLNVDGKGAKAIVEADGSTAMAAGRIVADGEYNVSYDGTSFRLVPPGGYALPSGFLGAKRLRIPGTIPYPLELKTSEMFWRLHEGGVQKPKYATIEGDIIVFGPGAPDTFYQIEGLFFKKFTALSGASDTNWILTNARGLLLFGALVEGYNYLNDVANMTKYAAMRDDLLSAVHKSDRDDRYAGGGLTTQSDVMGA